MLAQSVECQSCGQEIEGLAPSRLLLGHNIHTYVPLSSSTVIWYWAKSGDVLQLERLLRDWQKVLASGITRVGDTRGGNWWCHPIFLRKNWRPFFSHHPLQSDDLFPAVVSSQLPPSYIVCSLCTSVLSEFGHKFLFRLGRSLHPHPSILTPLVLAAYHQVFD